MTPLPHFLEAEYTPTGGGDSVTFGVIVWTPDVVQARFCGEVPGRPGELSDKEIPKQVASHDAYRQWVHYWRRLIQRSEQQGRSKKWTAFRDEILASGRGNFRLAEGGYVQEVVAVENLSALLDQVYRDTVGDSSDVRLGLESKSEPARTGSIKLAPPIQGSALRLSDNSQELEVRRLFEELLKSGKNSMKDAMELGNGCPALKRTLHNYGVFQESEFSG